MPSRFSFRSFRSRLGGVPLIVLGALIFVAIAAFIAWNTRDQRNKSLATLPNPRNNEAMAIGAEQPNAWPSNPESLIAEFWQAAGRKDYDRLAVLCPDARPEEFKHYYDKYPPSPATAIGQAEPHPTAKGVQLFPVKVPFPGYPGKTIKMAIKTAEDGRLVIDGQNTIWW